MKLVERISTQTATQAAGQTPARTSLMTTSSPRRQRDAMADGFQQLKLAVHNRLFESLDVSRLESLEPTSPRERSPGRSPRSSTKRAVSSPTPTARA